MEEMMEFRELQEAVSVCLNEIVQLKKENAELVNTIKLLTMRVQEEKNGQAIHEQRITRLRNKMYRLQSNIAYLKNREKLAKVIFMQNQPDTAGTNIPFEGRGVVYSAVTGNYDTVQEIKLKNPNLDYIMFTDNPELKSDTWEIRLIDNPDRLDSVRLARRVKILGYEYLPDYDYSIWVDGKLEIVGDFEEYVKRYRDTRPMLCFNHYSHDCIYEEEEGCEILKKDSVDTMRRQIQKYKEEGYPAHNGLTETGILVRELHNKEVQTLMNTWWNEIIHHSYRDQLSFNYACWKCGFLYDTCSLLIYVNEYVALHGHN